MSVNIGTVACMDAGWTEKETAVKVLEEAAEVFGAWQECREYKDGGGELDPQEWPLCDMVGECADVVQAVCNLLGMLGVDDMREAMNECRKRNEARGREYEAGETEENEHEECNNPEGIKPGMFVYTNKSKTRAEMVENVYAAGEEGFFHVSEFGDQRKQIMVSVPWVSFVPGGWEWIDNVTPVEDTSSYTRLPLDADGMPIRPGDTVYGEDGREYLVNSITIKRGGDISAFVIPNDEKGFATYEQPSKLTHSKPDSWEQLEFDAECSAFEYAGKTGFVPDDNSESVFAHQSVDLVKRAKALAGVEQ